MKKISIKNIIEFRTKSEKSKKKFATDLNVNVEKTDTESGGDYWISSLSAISSAYRLNDGQIIKDKIDDLEDKLENAEFKRTKTMYQRNIDILYQYEDFDFKKWQPEGDVTFLKKQKIHSVLTIEGLQIQAMPSHVFTFERNDVKEIGAIWFIAKLGGYRKDESGMFTDILFRYLKKNFSSDYVVNPKYCLAIDAVKCLSINYFKIEKNEIQALLLPTIKEIGGLM